MSKHVWVVQGYTGEYSDHCEWILGAFYEEKAAQRLVVEAQARANEISQLKENDWDAWYELAERKDSRTINEFDPSMQLDYTGTRYTCFPVELLDAQTA